MHLIGKVTFCLAVVGVLGVLGLRPAEAQKQDAKKKSAVARPSPTPPKCPASFQVQFTTTCGDFVVEVNRSWAPIGADRFHEAVTGRFYDGCGFFRVVPNFVVQFGINGDPEVQKRWRRAYVKDDKSTGKSNLKGYVTFATSGPNTRTAQLFVNLKDNAFLDQMGFTPFGRVVKGMETVAKINGEYKGEPDQGRIQSEGNAYLKRNFAKLDFIKTARVVVPKKKADKKKATKK